MCKTYLTPSFLNAWLKGYDNFYDMLYRRDREPSKSMLKGIEFENKAVNGEIEELVPIINNALYQEFVCRPCCGYMLLGFCDLIKDDTIYDLKYVSSFEQGKYTDSSQHLIYLYCTDMNKFVYIVGKDKEIFYENQPRDDTKLKGIIKHFDDWVNQSGYKEVYQQNYSVERYKEQIESYLNW